MESADCKTNSMPVKSRAQIDSIYSGGPALACHKWYQITKKSGLSGLHLNLNRVSNPNCQCCKWPLTVHTRSLSTPEVCLWVQNFNLRIWGWNFTSWHLWLWGVFITWKEWNTEKHLWSACAFYGSLMCFEHANFKWSLSQVSINFFKK